MKRLLILTTILAATLAARGQYTNYYKTYFESCNSTADTLLIKGSSTIGTLTDHIAYPVEIRAERVNNPQTTNNFYAVSIRTTIGPQIQVDYLDYDELASVIQGVQYISQSTSSVTPLDNFETVIRTRSGLSIAKVGRGPKVVIAMTCGATNCVRNQMEPFVLDTLGRTLSAAKAKIDLVIASGQ
jgi:hypothetical protein